tara:strand:+ start:270 stop:659 length:390 start_codon:yes stop_codon:yes gene_type:complete
VVKLELNKGEVKMSVIKEIKRVFAPTEKQKKEDAETKKRFLKQAKEKEKEKVKKAQKRYKAKRAGAPDGKVIRQNKAPLYIHDAVKRVNDKKIKPRHLKSTTNPKKVAKTMTDQVEAMKMVDRNYLKGR